MPSRRKYAFRSFVQNALGLSRRFGIGIPQTVIPDIWQFACENKRSDIRRQILSPPNLFTLTSAPELIPSETPFSDMFTSLLAHSAQVVMPAWSLYSLPGAGLFTRGMMLADAYADVLFLDNATNHTQLAESVAQKAWTRYPRRIVETPALLAFDNWSKNYYYHWIIDALPRLLAQEHLPSETKLLLPDHDLPYFRESLDLLGLTVPEERIIRLQNHRYYRFDQLHYSAKRHVGLIPSLAAVTEVRKRLLQNAGTASTNPQLPKRLYISRRQAPTRRSANEDALEAMLQNFGIVTICAETLNLNEKIQLFQQADLIIATHGGGLTNLLFCAPGTTVLEVFTPNYVTPCFWCLSSQLKLQHHCIMAGQAADGQTLMPVATIRQVLQAKGFGC